MFMLLTFVALVFLCFIVYKVLSNWQRIITSIRAFWKLYNLKPKDLESFLNSYALFENDLVTNNDSYIVDYYSVLNHMCAMGEVEKMYIPPTIDPSKGVYDNQILFERKMWKDLNLNESKEYRVLDIGCGRGRIAAHCCISTGASVYGINIDNTQIQNAKENASKLGLTKKMDFQIRNFNDPLPFPDNYFDAIYEVQAFTYAKDYEKLFSEIHRVMKPGAKFSYLDWVSLDNYDPNNEYHDKLLKKVKPMIGAVRTPSPKEIEESLNKSGLKVRFSGDASLEGHQDNLILKADNYFRFLMGVINIFVFLKILPKHFSVLIERFTRDCDAFIECDKLRLFTSSYQIISQKN